MGWCLVLAEGMFEGGIIKNGQQDDDVGDEMLYSWDNSMYGVEDDPPDDVPEMEEVEGP